MSIHSSLEPGVDGDHLRVAMGYEDGRVELWALAEGSKWGDPSDARTGSSPWEKVYEGKKHNEASKCPTRIVYDDMFN